MNERVQAFWDCVKGSIYEQRDGARGELVCSSCAGHVGHVYRNEGFQNPPPNERHCVNSSALVFQPSPARSDLTGDSTGGAQHATTKESQLVCNNLVLLYDFYWEPSVDLPVCAPR